ncbi:MAG: hypothetical protein IKQ54_06890 [Oscillospiraceae bacterium]|nr:hypothetical protein [Oscillospiraceae bacterium]
MRYKRRIRLLAALLALTMLFSGCSLISQTIICQILPSQESAPATTRQEPDTSGSVVRDTTDSRESTAPVGPGDEALIRWQNAGQKDYLPEEPLSLVPFSEMEYQRPDVEALYADFDSLIALAETEQDADLLLERYYALYTRYISFYSMDTLANIRNSLDTTDPYYQEEYDFCEAETPTVEEKMEELNKAFAASPARDELEGKYFGKGYFFHYDDYEVYTNPEYLRLSQEENALLSEYRELTSDVQVTYRNVTKSLDEWMESDDYEEYIGALKAYYQQYNETVGDVFARLVRVRQQLAAALGYESYADYSYEVTYTRDYTPEQGESFLKGIRKHLVPILAQAYESSAAANYSAGYVSEEKVMEFVRSAAEQLGGTVWDAYRFMQEYQLCDIGKSAKKTEASFQIYIHDYEAPFVLVNAQGSAEDYTTFSHEFGHFTDAYYNYGANEDLETAETFSQAMEFLALSHNGVLNERQSERMLRHKLVDALETFVYQGAYADFEARVYALKPKEVSVEKINELYLQCCKDYGIYERGFDFYYSMGWIDIIHFFEVPYYIISYCVSAETALQVYQLEAETAGAGVDAYFRLLDRDYNAGVQQVMKDAGLENPFRDDVLEETAAFFRRELGLK